MAKQVIALEATLNSGPAEGSVKSLKAQLREAQAEVAAMSDKFGETSVEAANAAKKAAELKDRIGDAKALTEAFNPDKKFQAFSTALNGVVGGFTALQGATALFGAKSEELEKTLLKVQGAMALSQGLSAITESIDAFKNLKVVAVAAFNSIRAAISSTGIGVLVVAIGAIVAALIEYANTTDSATEAAKRQKQAEEDLKTSIKNTNDELDNRNKINDYVLQKELINAKARGASIKELRKIEDAYWYQKRLDAQTALEEADAEVERLKKQGYYKNETIKADGTKELTQLGIAAEQAKKLREDYYKTNQQFDLLEANRRLEDYNNLKNTNKDKQKEIKDDNDYFLESTIERANIQEQALKDYNDIIKGFREQEYLDQYNADLAQKELEKRTNEELLAGRKAAAEASVEITKAETDAKIMLQNAYLDTIGNGISILKMFADKNKGLQKALLIAENGLTIARIILDTQRAIVAARTSVAGIPPFLPGPVPVPNPKYVLAQTIANANIAQSKIAAGIGIAQALAATAKGLSAIGGGGSAGGGGSINAGGGGGTIGASAPVAPQVSNTALNQQLINQTGNAAIRTYVVESDVAGNQERIQRLNRAARIN